MKTTISKKFFSICFATIFTSLLFAEVELPNRDRAKDKAKFGVNDIVYIEELTLNSCSILPSIEIANRIKNGALLYPFYPFDNYYGENGLTHTETYKNNLPKEYQLLIANKATSTFDGISRNDIMLTIPNKIPGIFKAEKKFDKNYKDFHQKLLTAIEKQSKEKDPKFSLRNIDFDNDIYDVIYVNVIVGLELFGYTEEYDKESGLFYKDIIDRVLDKGLFKNNYCEDISVNPKYFKEFYSLSK